ncbi:MAG TPA: NUDIX domain-containing protein [Nitrososphaeraceae archaeon]
MIKYSNPNIGQQVPVFLLLRNRRGYWGFPQGHKEKGESEMQTLEREVNEETGIRSLDVLSFIGAIRYSYFRSDGMKNEKEVKFYYATTPVRNVVISAEHESYKWASFVEALNFLNHRQLRSIFMKGHSRGLY